LFLVPFIAFAFLARENKVDDDLFLTTLKVFLTVVASVKGMKQIDNSDKRHDI